MVYKKVGPAQLCEGDRAWYQGRLHTVERISHHPDLPFYYVFFFQGLVARFSSPLVVVDEDATNAELIQAF